MNLSTIIKKIGNRILSREEEHLSNFPKIRQTSKECNLKYRLTGVRPEWKIGDIGFGSKDMSCKLIKYDFCMSQTQN